MNRSYSCAHPVAAVPVCSVLFLLLQLSAVFAAPEPDRLDPSSFPSSEPVQTYNRGLNQFEQDRFEQAREAFVRVTDTAQNNKLKARASYMKARCTFEGEDYIGAIDDFQSFSRAYPNSTLRREALRYQLDAAFKLMNGEQNRTLLGLPILSARGTGERVVRKILEEYPFEKFSDDYQYRLANVFYERNEYAAAAEEYLFLIDQYDRSIWRPSARFLAGVSFFRTVNSISYDTQNLDKAKKQFDKYLNRYPDGSFVDRARSYIQRINRKLAEKNLRIAEWYTRTGRTTGAIFYYKEVLRIYPKTDQAQTAVKRLRDIDHPNAALTDPLKQKINTPENTPSKRKETN